MTLSAILLIVASAGCSPTDEGVPQGSSITIGPEIRRFGGDGESPERMIGRVGAALVNGELVYVADATDMRIKVFDLDGSFRFSFGRQGSGPGEIRNFAALAPVHGDSIAIFDRALGRISLFSREGQFGRAIEASFRDIRPGWIPLVVAGDARIIGVRVETDHPDYREVDKRWGMAEVSIIDPSGPSEQLVATAPWRSCRPEFPERCRPDPQGRFGEVTVNGARIMVSPANAPEIRVFDSAGHEQTSLQAPTLGEVAFYGMNIDRAGRIWAGIAGSEDWAVFAPEGEFRGVAAMPEAFELIGFSESTVIGVFRDSLSVPWVQVRHLDSIEPRAP